METVTYFIRTNDELGFALSLREGGGLFNFHMSNTCTYLYILGVRFVQFY